MEINGGTIHRVIFLALVFVIMEVHNGVDKNISGDFYGICFHGRVLTDCTHLLYPDTA